jgi:hypothetical protein
VWLLIWGLFSPVGTLVWWLEQGTATLEQQGYLETRGNSVPALLASPSSHSTPQASAVDCYIVYLPGVGEFSADQLTDGEAVFLDRLAKRYPHCAIVDDVFPYSVANIDLTQRQWLGPLWRAAEESNFGGDVLIKIRNLWRSAISADDRYGPVYSRGIADSVIQRMNAAHPIVQGRSLQVILIGTSGGVQVALGALPYLDRQLDAQLMVISAGGVFDGGTGFEVVDQMYHLQGARDWVEDLGRILFTPRWPVTVGSPFNQARQQGRYKVLPSGPHAHDGREGYFGLAIVRPNTRYVDLTLEVVTQLPIWSAVKP